MNSGGSDKQVVVADMTRIPLPDLQRLIGRPVESS